MEEAMDFLYLLENIRVPVLNEIMLLITRLGEETAFLVLALIIFWCVDKYKGYYVLGVGLMGNLVNQFTKLVCRVPRPWIQDPNFKPMPQAIEAASGYSFPSGHTQTAVGTFGSIVATLKQRTIRIICIVLAVLVGFSRMYVGVHTPKDVLVGALTAIALVLILRPLMLGKGKRLIPYVFGVMLLCSIAFLLFVEFHPHPELLDTHNYESAIKNAYTFLGCFVGILIVYFADENSLRFSVEAVWWAQILKIVLGLAAVLLVKEGTRVPLDFLCGGHMIARSIRYCLIVVTAGIVWPLTFRWFGKMGKSETKSAEDLETTKG